MSTMKPESTCQHEATQEAQVIAWHGISFRKRATTIAQMMLWGLFVGLITVTVLVTSQIGTGFAVHWFMVSMLNMESRSWAVVIPTLTSGLIAYAAIYFGTKKFRSSFYAKGEQRIMERLRTA